MSLLGNAGIGKKFAIVSGIGIALVAVLVAATLVMLTNVGASMSFAVDQARIAQLVTRSATDLQILRVAARDIRLTTDAQKVAGLQESAGQTLADLESALTEAESLMVVQANKDRAKTILDLAHQYDAELRNLATIVAREITAGVPAGVVSPERDASRAKLLDIASASTQLSDEATSVAVERSGEYAADAEGLISTTIIVSLVLGGLVGIVLVFALVFNLRAIVGPVRAITERMKALTTGDITSVIPFSGRTDEIGAMAGAVEVFRENAERVRDMNLSEQERLDIARRRNEAMAGLMSGLDAVVGAAVDGDFSQRLTFTAADQDLLQVADNVNQLVETVDRGIGEVSTVLAALANTDLTLRMNGEYRGAFAQLKNDTNAVVDRLGSVITQLRQTSATLKTATGEILAGANDLSERTTRQAAAIEETSAAMEQLSGTVNENATRAELASTKAKAVSETAASTGNVMRSSNEAMERISSSSHKISNIIGLIDDIAFQTNLLALNASVEAARAGEAGKGFAVVAVEVRRLAQSAAQASAEVKELIEQSGQEVSAGGRLVAEATQKLVGMLDDIRESTDLIGAIAHANHEQSSAIAEVTTAIRQMDEMTQHNAALVEETNAAIEQTENQANELDRVVEVFVLSPAAGTARTGQPAARTVGKAMPERARPVAKTYRSQGNAAIDSDWNEL